MSRIGRMPIAVPAGVTVTLDGHEITVKGAKETLTRTLHPAVNVEVKDGQILVTPPTMSRRPARCTA